MGRIVSTDTEAPEPFATLDDYVARHGAVPTEDEARVEALLAEVSATIRAHTGQRITRATTTQRFPIRRGKVTLTDRPIHDIVSVKVARSSNALAFTRVSDTEIQFDQADLIVGDVAITETDVEYDHGYDDSHDPRGVLPRLAGMTLDLTARAYGVRAQDSGVTQESIQGYSYQIGGAAAAGSSGLLPAEEKALDKLVGKPLRATTFAIAP